MINNIVNKFYSIYSYIASDTIMIISFAMLITGFISCLIDKFDLDNILNDFLFIYLNSFVIGIFILNKSKIENIIFLSILLLFSIILSILRYYYIKNNINIKVEGVEK